jgi:hypothetical protein
MSNSRVEELIARHGSLMVDTSIITEDSLESHTEVCEDCGKEESACECKSFQPAALSIESKIDKFRSFYRKR